jgi:hypothetical protein
MTLHSLHRISCIAVSAIVVWLSSTAAASAQTDFGTPSQTEALSAAAKANPELAQGLAKELGSTPEQAAGAAAVFFGIAKSFLKPEDFAALSKAVPGMDALLAAAPPEAAGTPGSALSGSGATPGFASSSSSPSTVMTAAPDGMSSAISAISKLGIKPEMIAKAIPFLSGYLKKYGGDAVASLLGGLFKKGK